MFDKECVFTTVVGCIPGTENILIRIDTQSYEIFFNHK